MSKAMSGFDWFPMIVAVLFLLPLFGECDGIGNVVKEVSTSNHSERTWR